MGATKKKCTFLLEIGNCAKNNFRNYSNYSKGKKHWNPGGHYFTESHKIKYCFFNMLYHYLKDTAKTTLPNSTKFSQSKLHPFSSVLAYLESFCKIMTSRISMFLFSAVQIISKITFGTIFYFSKKCAHFFRSTQ